MDCNRRRGILQFLSDFMGHVIGATNQLGPFHQDYKNVPIKFLGQGFLFFPILIISNWLTIYRYTWYFKTGAGQTFQQSNSKFLPFHCIIETVQFIRRTCKAFNPNSFLNLTETAPLPVFRLVFSLRIPFLHEIALRNLRYLAQIYISNHERRWQR